MTIWGDDYHPTHTPDKPRDIGFGTGLVYCRACATLLRSSKGVGLRARVRQECQPVRVGPRGSALPLAADSDVTSNVRTAEVPEGTGLGFSAP